MSLAWIRMNRTSKNSKASAFHVASGDMIMSAQYDMGLITEEVVGFATIHQPSVRMMAKHHVDITWVRIKMVELGRPQKKICLFVILV